MKIQRFIIAILFMAGVFASTAWANHTDLVGEGPFKTGPDVTKKCLVCHEKETKDFMKTVHWTWSKEQTLEGGKKVNIGKINALNNFCIGLPANWPRCTSCHAGYGFKDANFDFTKAENVDCLVCHVRQVPTRNFQQVPGTRSMRGAKGISERKCVETGRLGKSGPICRTHIARNLRFLPLLRWRRGSCQTWRSGYLYGEPDS